MLNDEVVLIITACIKPNSSMKFLELFDESVRLEQYINSLRYYIQKTTIKNIIFADNSDYPYDYSQEQEYAKELGKNLEVYHFQGDAQKAVEQGKGYGEGEILAYVFEASKLLQGRTCVKVTGRLIVENIDSIIKKIKKNRIYMNINLFGLESVDTRCYIVPEEKYRKYYVHEYQKVSDEIGDSIEIIFAKKNKSLNERIYNIPLYPVIKGISGSSGICYEKEGKRVRKMGTLFSMLGIYNYKIIGKVMLRIRGDIVN